MYIYIGDNDMKEEKKDEKSCVFYIYAISFHLHAVAILIYKYPK